jgi:hypothetical protein
MKMENGWAFFFPQQNNTNRAEEVEYLSKSGVVKKEKTSPFAQGERERRIGCSISDRGGRW